jgi:hypothetical protein
MKPTWSGKIETRTKMKKKGKRKGNKLKHAKNEKGEEKEIKKLT